MWSEERASSSICTSICSTAYAFAKENGYREMLGRARNIYDIAVRRSKKDSKLQIDVLQLDAVLQKYKKGVFGCTGTSRANGDSA